MIGDAAAIVRISPVIVARLVYEPRISFMVPRHPRTRALLIHPPMRNRDLAQSWQAPIV
jgi:hypothetical protein